VAGPRQHRDPRRPAGRAGDERPALPAARPVRRRRARGWAGQVLTFWAGTPFVVERRIDAADYERGYADVEFTAEQSLPAGPVTFHVGLIVESGAQADFTVSVAVLPSNPFSLRLSPRDNFVTGTFSARAVKSGNAYQTDVTVTLSNGDATPVAMRQDFTWEFWDGPVGAGTLVEQAPAGFLTRSQWNPTAPGTDGSCSPRPPAPESSISWTARRTWRYRSP
jgi:hypothetical protein